MGQCGISHKKIDTFQPFLLYYAALMDSLTLVA